MKKLFMIAVAAMLATVSVNAQEEAGQMYVKPMVGATLSTFTGDVKDTKMKLGLVAGAEFGYHVMEPLAITAGALVSMQGSKFDDNSYEKDVTTTVTYLNVPIMANYYIVRGLAIKAGLQPGFLLSRKTKYSTNTGSGWVDMETTDKEHMKKVDFSIPLGLSYEFSNFVIDARYNLGLSNINDDSNYKSKNSVFMLTLGYKIPF
jgi:hypothetical protein